ncbi:MAG: hypothetical protein JRE40_09070 [Deltaproteobacteria bacterium]|nr:hypothetical protein [Deltaproteobacteria bacterium]
MTNQIGNAPFGPALSNRAQPVTNIDRTSDVIDLYMYIVLNDAAQIAVPVSVDDRVVTLEPGHGVVAGNHLFVCEGDNFYQVQALDVDTNDITVDSPSDHEYSAGTSVCVVSTNMAVDGSVTPVIARLAPLDGTKIWKLARIIFHIGDNSAMDDSTFGGISGGLENGCVLRKKNGTRRNLFNVKSNGDFAERSFDVGYDDRAPAGTYGFRARKTFNGPDRNGVVIPIDPADNEEAQLIIQDDLTSLLYFRAVLHGYVEDEEIG